MTLPISSSDELCHEFRDRRTKGVDQSTKLDHRYLLIPLLDSLDKTERHHLPRMLRHHTAIPNSHGFNEWATWKSMSPEAACLIPSSTFLTPAGLARASASSWSCNLHPNETGISILSILHVIVTRTLHRWETFSAGKEACFVDRRTVRIPAKFDRLYTGPCTVPSYA
jgi:hypothetical protein